MLQVSWVRHRDIHLLTVGRYTYTSDQRFEAIHSPHTEDWTLRIRYPQRKDSGIYECQISTTPPVGHPVYLTVVGMLQCRVMHCDVFIELIISLTLLYICSKVTPKPRACAKLQEMLLDGRNKVFQAEVHTTLVTFLFSSGGSSTHLRLPWLHVVNGQVTSSFTKQCNITVFRWA